MSEVLPELDTRPVLRIHLDDLTHPALKEFVSLVDCARVLPNAIKTVLQHLYVPYGLDKIPKVRSVTLILRPMGGVAYTTGLPIDDLHKEIHLSLDYIGKKSKDPLGFRDETIGVITHEMVHCFQHNCRGSAPGGLIEGIADYVRLKAGLAPPHWKKSPEERGKEWDEGYQRTAWFLEWLEDNRGAGTISKMNETMGRADYEEEKFWHGLFGEPIETLWKRYTQSWQREDEDTNTACEPAIAAETEPEVVDLSQEEKDEAAEQAKTPKEFQA